MTTPDSLNALTKEICDTYTPLFQRFNPLRYGSFIAQIVEDVWKKARTDYIGEVDVQSVVSECCSENVDGGRFCPKCGWECRVKASPSEISEHGGDANYWKTRYLLLEQRTKATKPVTISREEALRAYSNGRAMAGAESMNLLNSTQREDVRHEGGIKAILDAAGVKYAD